MMKKQIAAVVLAVSVVGGVGTGVLANALVSDDPASAKDDASRTTSTPTATSSVRPTASSATVARPLAVKDLTITPGALGPVTVGMSKKQAVATGLFDADVVNKVDGCPVAPLVWKLPYGAVVDVATVGNGEITSLGVRAKGPTTKDGLGIGSTLADVEAAVSESQPVEAGYGQTGLFDYDTQTGRWIGYLFDAPVADISDDSPVTFIEVTKGAQPGLMRDGC